MTAEIPQNYPWYDLVNGDRLLQGDFLDRCPIIIPPERLHVPNLDERSEDIKVGVRTYDVLVMSQSCDLKQEKLDLVLLCPHWSLEEFSSENPFFGTVKGKEQLRRGNVPGYHLLAEQGLDGNLPGIRVVDFRTVYSLPLNFIKAFAASAGTRIRLLPPYREHLSQAFARFFMRVGLPVDIPPFT